MNRLEYMLTKLAEECAEVGQRTTKALCFGIREVQPGQNLDNHTRLGHELRDLLVVVDEIEKMTGPFFGLMDSAERSAKLVRIEHYMQHSRVQGCLQD